MSGCPTVHHHPEFDDSYNPEDKTQKYEVDKLKRFLKANPEATGERLTGDLSPLRSFPTRHKDVRCLFILCRECKKEAFVKRCDFCESENHTMHDGVLFLINSDHDTAYKLGKKAYRKYKMD